MNSIITQDICYQEDLETLNVLIVDDDKQVSLVTKKMVEKLGHVAVVAESGRQAIQKITENNYDLILLDLGLPDGRGILLVPEIRKFAGDVNIVIMTGNSSWETEKTARENRIMYYLLKPFSFDEMKSIIEHLAMKKARNSNSSN